MGEKEGLLEDHYILVEEAPCDDNDWKKVPTKLSSAWINEDEKFFYYPPRFTEQKILEHVVPNPQTWPKYEFIRIFNRASEYTHFSINIDDF